MSSKLQEKLQEWGYQCFIMREGVLLDDELWVHPDTVEAYKNGTPNPKYVFVLKVKFLNEWSSTHTHRRYKKLCKKHLELLELCD